VQKPLATVVIGGLISATFLTLVVLPVIYILFNDPKSEGMKIIKKVLPVIIVCLIIPSLATGQNQEIQQRISLEDAISLTMEHNLILENTSLAYEQSEKLKKTAYNIPNPQFNLERGQMHSSLIDNAYTISQSFHFPTIYTSDRKYLNQSALLQASKIQVVRNDIVAEVTSAYYDWLMIYVKRKVLLTLDSVYQDFQYAADKKFELGESNEIEKLLAQAKSKQVMIYINENEADISIAEKRLKQLMNVDGNFLPADTSLVKLSLDDKIPDSSLIRKNPLLEYYQRNIFRQNAFLKNQKNQYLPDFQVGYFNMSIDHIHGFQGWYLGLDIPIWLWSNAGHVQAAKIESQIAENAYQEKKLSTILEFEKLQHEYEKLKKSLGFYEDTALEQSQILVKNASRSYNEGDISYLEFVQLTSEAIDIVVNYLETLNRYNQTIIQIKHITGAYRN
jgi:cobalt-zinc-cadmium resistance protein CzcA